MKKKSKNEEKKINPPEEDSKNISIPKKQNYVSWAVFLFTVSIVLISLTSVVFPAFIASGHTTIKELEAIGIEMTQPSSVELGVWARPLLAANIVVFVIAFLYFKQKLPIGIKSKIDFIFNFEASKKVTIIVILVLLAIYVASSAGELWEVEEWEDYPPLKQRIEIWSFDQIGTSFETHVKYFLTWASMELFGSYRTIPFIASIALLITTYFITKEITGKRFAGIISLVILLQSNLFLTYDTTVSYTNFWILFYLLSLFLIYKFWPISPFFYIISLSSKPLTALFLPMALYFILSSKISRNKKIIITSLITVLVFGAASVAMANNANLTGSTTPGEFSSDDFWLGFTSFSYQLRFDGVVLVFLLPLIVGLFLASKRGIYHANSMMVMMGVILLIAPFLTGFTELTNQPYRFVPFVVFFAIGVGVLLSKSRI